MGIIDIHTHPVFFGQGGDESSINELVRYARKLGIERMVALGDVLRYGSSPDSQQLATLNDTTLDLMRRHPDFFVGFCYLNPTLGESALRRELDLRIEQGFQGIKLEIANNATSPVMKPLMRAAAEAGLPTLQHTWDTQGKRMRKTHSDPIDTCQLAKNYPDVPIIMAHLYSYGTRGILEAANIDNLYVDTSACLPFSGILEKAVDVLGDHRILYGSDLPIRELGQCIGRVTGSAIPDISKTRILFENAARLLGLSTPIPLENA